MLYCAVRYVPTPAPLLEQGKEAGASLLATHDSDLTAVQFNATSLIGVGRHWQGKAMPPVSNKRVETNSTYIKALCQAMCL